MKNLGVKTSFSGVRGDNLPVFSSWLHFPSIEEDGVRGRNRGCLTLNVGARSSLSTITGDGK